MTSIPKVSMSYEPSRPPCLEPSNSPLVAEFLESRLLSTSGFRHAFFTRLGGVSAGPYRSLNFSVAVGDAEENVRANLERAAAPLGVVPRRIYYLSQVHGREVVALTGSESRAAVLELRGDALVASAPDLACGVRSADCVPILIADRRNGGVAAIHAGWRGVVAGVVPAAVRLLGTRGHAPELVAAIGPHISSSAFEVSPEIADEIAGACGDASIVDRSRGARPYVDLRRAVRRQLIEAGLDDSSVDDVLGCTVGEPERFFSYRRDGQKSGRHLSAIVPRSQT
jgi:polyphenol oxidase